MSAQPGEGGVLMLTQRRNVVLSGEAEWEGLGDSADAENPECKPIQKEYA